MRTVNIHEAKTHLSRLVEQAAKGEPFVIAKAGKPMVKVTPLDTPAAGQVRRLGFMAGRIQVPDDFHVDARLLRRGLLDNGYGELPVTSEHAVAINGLPPIHKDPFDRLLIAQSMVEGITLLTNDPLVAQYSAPVRQV